MVDASSQGDNVSIWSSRLEASSDNLWAFLDRHTGTKGQDNAKKTGKRQNMICFILKLDMDS